MMQYSLHSLLMDPGKTGLDALTPFIDVVLDDPYTHDNSIAELVQLVLDDMETAILTNDFVYVLNGSTRTAVWIAIATKRPDASHLGRVWGRFPDALHVRIEIFEHDRLKSQMIKILPPIAANHALWRDVRVQLTEETSDGMPIGIIVGTVPDNLGRETFHE